MKLNRDEYEGLRSFQVLTPAKKKGFLFFGKILQFLFLRQKEKKSKETWNHSNMIDEIKKNPDVLHFFF